MEIETQIVSKKIQFDGKEALAKLLCVDGKEGMLSTHLAEIVNIANSTMREHIKKHAISAQALPAHSLRTPCAV